MTTKISGTGFDELVVDNLVLSNPLPEQYGGSGSTGVYKMGYATPKSATGTFVDFTGIPSWAKRITVMFSGVSTNGTSIIMVQLGDSGGIENTGYLSSASVIEGGGLSSSNFTTGFGVGVDNTGTYTMSGDITITKFSPATNLYTPIGIFRQASSRITMASGEKTLSDILSQIRITTVNGTDLFDAGTINVMWEGFA